jgi:hypothetical protein
MKWTTIKSLLICLGLVLALFGALYGLLSTSASAKPVQPPFPHVFWGHVTIDGAPSPKGTRIMVDDDDHTVHIPITGNPLTTTEIGIYGEPDPPLTAQGDYGTDELKFYIDGKRARCYDPNTGQWSDTYDFWSGGVTELNLFYTGTYTLTVISEGCCPISVTYDTTTATVAAETTGAFTNITGGVTATLEAFDDPGACCVFGGWIGDLLTTTNPVTFPMRSDMVITATAVQEYELTVHETGSGGGAVTRVPEQAIYLQGTVVTLTAVPSDTSVFELWSGDVPPGSSESSPVAITMDDDKAITATFEFYSVTVAPPTDEKGDNPDSEVYYHLQVTNTGGAVDTFTVTAISGHEWSLNVIPTPTVESVAIGESKEVILFVQIPAKVIFGTVDVVTLTVTSQGDPRKSATALLTTTSTGGTLPNRIFMPLIVRTGETH